MDWMILFAVPAAFLILMGIMIWMDNNRLTVSRYSVRSSGINRPIRIVLLSDLHNKQFGRRNKLLVRTILEQKPDMIAFVGDLEDRRMDYCPSSVAFLTGLAQKIPVLFVFGNQEMRGGFKSELTEELKKGGVTVLEDDMTDLNINGQRLAVMGLNDYRYERRAGSDCGRSKILLEQFQQKRGFRLLLTHYPHFFYYYKRNYRYSDYRIDLILSGHAHGGLIRLPFLKGAVAPGQGFFPRYTAGLYQRNGVRMIVSRGLGNSGWPFRIFNPPEVVAVDLSGPAGS